MKNFFKLVLTISAILSFSSSAYAISATANARVVTPITVTQTTALQFGSFTSSGVLGTITQAGVVTGGVTAVTGGATRAAGVFAVAGETTAASTPYTFTFPTTASLANGANTMTATLSLASGTATRTLTNGAETVTVNGSLAVAANQAAGAYTGTYIVTVAY